jgi:hypothetical protein
MIEVSHGLQSVIIIISPAAVQVVERALAAADALAESRV